MRGKRSTDGPAVRAPAGELEAGLVDRVDLERAEVGPGDVGEQPEHAVDGESVRSDEPVREEVEAQRRLEGVLGRR
jgi:hypothetical protein